MTTKVEGKQRLREVWIEREGSSHYFVCVGLPEGGIDRRVPIGQPARQTIRVRENVRKQLVEALACVPQHQLGHALMLVTSGFLVL